MRAGGRVVPGHKQRLRLAAHGAGGRLGYQLLCESQRLHQNPGA
jgi:hypothetical protein